MRILLLTYSCSPNNGGEEKVGWQWALQLAQQVHEVVVITKYEPGKKETIDTYLRENKITNLYVEYINMSENIFFSLINEKIGTMTFRIFIYQFFLYNRVKEIVEKYSFDIIHQVTPVNFRVPFLSSKINSIPTVLGPLGGGQVLKKWMYKYVGEDPKQKYRKLINQMTIKMPIINKRLQTTSQIFAGNESTKRIIEDTLGINAIYFSDIGVLKKDIIRNERIISCENNRVKLLWAGRLTPHKGLGLLIECLSKSIFKNSVELIVAGGEKKEVENYSTMAKEFGVNNIKFLGKIPYSEMKSLYRNVDAFIFTSMIDTGGSVLLEAASFGLPVILSDINGKKIFGENALYLDYSSRESAEDSINSSLEKIFDINLRSRLSKGSVLIANKNSWEEKAKSMVKVYKKLINSSC